MKNIIQHSKLLRTLLLASSVFVGSFSAQAGVMLSFSETDIEVNVNDTFNVDLFAATDTSITADSFVAFSTNFAFDNNLLSLDNITIGSDFIESLISADIAGIFNADISNPLQPIFTASGDNILLASLTFTALNAGATNLASVSESFLSLLPFITPSVESAFADVSVNAVPDSTVSVPAPATLVLFGLSLLLIMRLRKNA